MKAIEQTCSEPHEFLRLFQKTDVALPGSGEELLIEGTCELVKEDAIQPVSRAYLTKVLTVLPLSADMFLVEFVDVVINAEDELANQPDEADKEETDMQPNLLTDASNDQVIDDEEDDEEIHRFIVVPYSFLSRTTVFCCLIFIKKSN